MATGDTRIENPNGTTNNLKIAIIHFPFRGITGSDRLITDAALSFKSKGHTVSVFTADLDKRVALFSDTNKLNIISINTHLVESIHGAGFLFFYFLKSIIFLISTFGLLLSQDLIICDQLPTSIFLLFILVKLTFRSDDKRPTLAYYCHFPEFAHKDHLKMGPLTRAYRHVFDSLEKMAMSCVDVVYANSNFTKSAILGEYPDLKRVKVLYPGIPETISSLKMSEAFFERNPICAALRTTKMLCSINRFFCGKRLERILLLASAMKRKSRLFTTIIAGGIDKQGSGGWKYLEVLTAMCKEHSLSFAVSQANTMLYSSCSSSPSPFAKRETWDGDVDVLFLLDATSEQRDFILSQSSALFYSASKEHFGMALPEAMLSRCFAIGMGSGGPLEIIEHKVSGYLIPDYLPDGEDCPDDPFSPPEELIDMLEKLYGSGDVNSKAMPQELQTIIQNGFNRARSRYTINTFTQTILADHEARLSGGG